MMINILFIIMAVYFTYSTRRFLRSAQRVRGELVDYQSFRDDEGDWLHRPVYRFTDAHGQTLTASNPRNVWVVHKPSVGQQFDLLYNPANPSEILRDLWHEVWFAPIVFWTVGLMGLLHGVVG